MYGRRPYGYDLYDLFYPRSQNDAFEGTLGRLHKVTDLFGDLFLNAFFSEGFSASNFSLEAPYDFKGHLRRSPFLSGVEHKRGLWCIFEAGNFRLYARNDHLSNGWSLYKNSTRERDVAAFANFHALHDDRAGLLCFLDDLIETVMGDDSEPVHGGKLVIIAARNAPAKRQAQAAAPKSARLGFPTQTPAGERWCRGWQHPSLP